MEYSFVVSVAIDTKQSKKSRYYVTSDNFLSNRNTLVYIINKKTSDLPEKRNYYQAFENLVK